LKEKSASQRPSAGELGSGFSLSRVARDGDGATLAISGEIDIANADAFTDEVHSHLEGADGQVTLDLQNCHFIDSTGLRALVALAEEQRARAQTLKLSGVTGGPLRVLELSGLLDSGLFANGGESSAWHPAGLSPGK